MLKDDIKITEAFKLWNEENTNKYFDKKTLIADYCI
jgi:hypothetical protein